MVTDAVLGEGTLRAGPAVVWSPQVSACAGCIRQEGCRADGCQAPGQPGACVTAAVFVQCRTVKIAILGDEGVPVQVDGEAWVQPPGCIRIVHKNRAQMLTRDRVRAACGPRAPSEASPL